MLISDRSQIPAEIDTVERLLVWCSSILTNKYPNAKVQEVQGEAPQLVSTCAPFQIRKADIEWNYDNHYRASGRFSFPIDSDFFAKKLWQVTGNVGDAADTIPEVFWDSNYTAPEPDDTLNGGN
ncbi:MAG: hypothetical protein F6K45_26710 [Kamptonema sp. SIO1D9]|nr:hypothetical protein [Kamptonema sp. SIO1D9]